MWDLPRPGIEPVSSALASRFFITEPPGEPSLGLLIASDTRTSSKSFQQNQKALTLVGYTALPWRRFPGGSEGKASACNAGDLGSTPGREDPLEKEMATPSSNHAWKIPQTEEPGRLQRMGSQRVTHG